MSTKKQLTNKPLLVFAHPGEAQVFIKNDRLHKLQDTPKLYHGNNYSLLITGGGMEKTLYTTTEILSQSQTIRSYSEIINLGIAAALSTEIKLHHIYSIATVYSYREGKPVYESFLLNILPGPRTSNIRDCLTTASPITHARTRQRLSAFADIADMELWWIAYAAMIKEIPLRAVKIISDYAHRPSKKDIQSQSKFYSQELYDFYYQQIAQTNPDIPHKNFHQSSKTNHLQKVKNKIFTTLKVTYQTQSQRRIIESLITQLIGKYSCDIEIKTEKILFILQSEMIKNRISSKINSKKEDQKRKTKTIIDMLRKIVFPISHGYHRRLIELTSISGIDINYDAQLESPEITTSFTASTLGEWKKKKETLNSIPTDKIFSTLNGQDNV